MKRIVLGLVLLGACGGDEKKEPTPTEKCEALLETICVRNSECASPLKKEDCVTALAITVPCGKATGVLQSYDSCMAKLPTWDCSLLVNDNGAVVFPADCTKVIVTPPQQE